MTVTVMVDGNRCQQRLLREPLNSLSLFPSDLFVPLNAYVSIKMSPWVPQPAGLQDILQTIHESTTTSVTVQRSITEVRRLIPLPRIDRLTRYLLET